MKQTKKCSHCKQKLDLSEFQKNRTTKDGLQNNCRQCRRRYQRGNKYKAYQKAYRQTEKGKLVCRLGDRRRKVKDKDKIRARNAICHAIRDGKIASARQFKCGCGSKATQYHHHKGYAIEFWFDVIPVCSRCHMKLDVGLVKIRKVPK